MIFRLSEKLAKKIKTVPTTVLPPDANPYADWSGHLFTADRTQYVLLTNTASLYSTLTYGRGIACDNDLLKQALSQIWEFMSDDGLEFAYQRFIAPTAGRIYFSKPLNRSVISSMNELVYHAKRWLTERDLSPHDTSF